MFLIFAIGSGPSCVHYCMPLKHVVCGIYALLENFFSLYIGGLLDIEIVGHMPHVTDKGIKRDR